MGRARVGVWCLPPPPLPREVVGHVQNGGTRAAAQVQGLASPGPAQVAAPSPPPCAPLCTLSRAHRSCGQCKEVKCKGMNFADGYGQWLERTNVCYNNYASVVGRPQGVQ